jgi:hypothetical protein
VSDLLTLCVRADDAGVVRCLISPLFVPAHDAGVCLPHSQAQSAVAHCATADTAGAVATLDFGLLDTLSVELTVKQMMQELFVSSSSSYYPFKHSMQELFQIVLASPFVKTGPVLVQFCR